MRVLNLSEIPTGCHQVELVQILHLLPQVELVSNPYTLPSG